MNRNRKILKRSKLYEALIATGLMVASGFVVAAEEVSDKSQSNIDTTGEQAAEKTEEKAPSYFETIIVTGASKGQSKFDTSYAITHFTAEKMQESMPLSTADLVGRAPGIFAESTGGESGNVVRVRGILNDGEQIYFMEDGMSVYGHVRSSYFSADSLIRNDLMTTGMEVVRGGPAPIYATDSPAMFNFITRQGTEDHEGAVRVTVGSPNMYKVEGFYSGPIAEDTYVAMGGFYRRNEGLKEHSFAGDDGGQFRINLRHELDNGELRFFYKYFNDRNVFYQSVQVNDPRTGESIPGYDPLKAALMPGQLQNFDIKYMNQDGNVVTQQHDISDGRHISYNNYGFEFDLEVGRWSLTNKLRYLDGGVNFDAVYPSGGAVVASDYLSSFEGAALAAFPTATHVGYAIAGSNGTDVYDPSTSNGLVDERVYRYITNGFKSIHNDFRATTDYELAGNHTFTAGFYLAKHKADLGRNHSNILVEMDDTNPRLLDIVAYDGANNTVGYVTDNGVVSHANEYRRAYGETVRKAIYFTDTWTASDALVLDFGVRYDMADFEASHSGSTDAIYDLGDSSTLADNATKSLQADADTRSFDQSYTNWTVGFNYTFSDTLGVYGRASKSNIGSDDDIILFNDSPRNSEADLFEFGAKLSTDTFDVFATAFYTKYSPFSDTIMTIDGPVSYTGEVTSPGIEVDFVWRVLDNFSVEGAWTVSDTQLGDMTSPDGVTSPTEGNQPRRQPNVYGTVEPTFFFEIDGWDAKAFVRYSYMGERFVDYANSTAMAAFGTWGMGVSASNDDWTILLVGDNITNELGVTEGDPIADSLAGQGFNQAIFGRTNFGASFQFSVMRSF